MQIFSFEKKAIEVIEKNVNILFFAVITVLAIVLRHAGRDFFSNDMGAFLVPWHDQVSALGGFKGLGTQVGDYNVLYQTLIAFMTCLPGEAMIKFKVLSIIFDFLLAFASAWMITDVTGKKKFGSLFQIVYAVILFLPTVILNSAWWGQCDVIYAFFLVMMLYFLYKGKNVAAFVFYGIAFAFKFQAIFLLPFVICYYFYKKGFSICCLGITAFVFWFSGILTYINGRDILAPFKIYASQTGTYREMYLNVCSFWMLIGSNYDWMKDIAIMTTIILCGLGLLAVIARYKKMGTIEQFLNTAAWFAWVCVMFLPAMHERYTFVLDILLVLLTFINVKYLKYAVTSVVLSSISYGAYLFGNGGLNEWYVWALVAFWIHFTYTIVKQDLALGNEEALEVQVEEALVEDVM